MFRRPTKTNAVQQRMIINFVIQKKFPPIMRIIDNHALLSVLSFASVSSVVKMPCLMLNSPP